MNQLVITYVTHACLKIKGDFGVLITDPWILNEPVYAFTTWKFPAAVMSPEEVIHDVDYLYLSHPHEDHFHIPSINLFPRHIKILLPEYSDYPGLRAQTVERTFRALGFYNIKKLKPFETIDLGHKAHFSLIPAAKKKYWDWENSGFVLDHLGTKMINMNDCPADAEVYDQVDNKFGEFDIGFIQYSGVSMFPGCFRMSMDEIKEASTRRKHSWIQQRHMIEKLKVKRLAPFAGDFSWLDDRLYHCNWSNRSTPKLFEDFVQQNYPDKKIEVVIMSPTDTWTKETGLTLNHPEIDWDNYLEHIDKVRNKFHDKVIQLRRWLEDAPCQQLEERTKVYLDYLNKWMTKEYVDFNVNVKVQIEGRQANFVFYMCSSPEKGFYFAWDDVGAIDQTLYVKDTLWACVLDARILLTNLQWAAQQQEHVPFRIEIARFWFWFENHADLNNRNIQALIDTVLHPELTERIRPQLGIFPCDNEWDKSWLEVEETSKVF